MSAATDLREKATAIADQTPDVVELYAPNVIVALLRVMRDLPAIGKDQSASAQQGGYAYRGIEQITEKAKPLFARHGVLFVPRVVHHEIRDLTVNSKPWTDTILLVEYDVYGPGGVEDRITIGPILAIGRDNSDKGGNKALTQAYKYALLQALAISDAKDDGDGQSHEADERRTHPLYDECMALGEKGEAIWADFLGRAGVQSGDAHEVLFENAGGWRDWLGGAIEHHRKSEEQS